MTRVLIIDDEELFREDLATLLRQEGFECQTASSGEQGLESADAFQPDIVLCDLVMPGISGIEVTQKLCRTHPGCAVLVISAHATVDTAISAFRRGAIDVILKPIVTEALINRLRRIEDQRKLQADVDVLRLELARSGPDAALVGSSAVMDDVRSLAGRVAAHDTPLLITGESGTGKEVVARMIHTAGRPTGPFVAVNCIAVTDSLFESQLFGHAKGAFTGAAALHRGFFETAQRGTLLLDEVGEIPLSLQGKLLRAVERHEITRVGETVPIPVDTRIIAATNRDLHAMVEDERFRTDLFYRLRVVHIEIPPLRQRPDDVRELAEHFLGYFAARMHLRGIRIDAGAHDALARYAWPGNVRELKNAIERAMIVGDGQVIRARDLPAEVRDGEAAADARSDDLRAAMRIAERSHIAQVLRRSGGNKTEAARRLGIDPSTLWRKLDDAGG